MSWVEPQPILHFTDPVSEAGPIASARGTLSFVVPSKQGANRYAEHLGSPSPIGPAFLEIRSMPPAHDFLLKGSSRFRVHFS